MLLSSEMAPPLYSGDWLPLHGKMVFFRVMSVAFFFILCYGHWIRYKLKPREGTVLKCRRTPFFYKEIIVNKQIRFFFTFWFYFAIHKKEFSHVFIWHLNVFLRHLVNSFYTFQGFLMFYGAGQQKKKNSVRRNIFLAVWRCRETSDLPCDKLYIFQQIGIFLRSRHH
jgi:hypothetical protein